MASVKAAAWKALRRKTKIWQQHGGMLLMMTSAYVLSYLSPVDENSYIWKAREKENVVIIDDDVIVCWKSGTRKYRRHVLCRKYHIMSGVAYLNNMSLVYKQEKKSLLSAAKRKSWKRKSSASLDDSISRPIAHLWKEKKNKKRKSYHHALVGLVFCLFMSLSQWRNKREKPVVVCKWSNIIEDFILYDERKERRKERKAKKKNIERENISEEEEGRRRRKLWW